MLYGVGVFPLSTSIFFVESLLPFIFVCKKITFAKKLYNDVAKKDSRCDRAQGILVIKYLICRAMQPTNQRSTFVKQDVYNRVQFHSSMSVQIFFDGQKDVERLIRLLQSSHR